MTLDGNLISIIVFYALIILFFYSKRKQIEVQGKVLFLLRTNKFLKTLENISKRFPRFWKFWGYAGIPVGFIGLAFVFCYLAYALVKLIYVPAAAPSISLVVPGVKIPGSAIFVPFWYGIISLFIVLVVHEGCHAIVAVANKQKLKSCGVGFLLFLPLAFVEPDEKKLLRSNLLKQLSVYAAGPFANICCAGLAFLVSMFLLAPAVGYFGEFAEGVKLASLDKGFPADKAGLKVNDVILYVDGLEINSTEIFINKMLSKKPGDTISLETKDRKYDIKTIDSPNNKTRAYLGIQFGPNTKLTEKAKKLFGETLGRILWDGLGMLAKLFYWIFVLNLGIGIINLLPLGPLDGGRMLGSLLTKKLGNKKYAMKLFAMLSWLSLMLLVFNLIGPYLLKISF